MAKKTYFYFVNLSFNLACFVHQVFNQNITNPYISKILLFFFGISSFFCKKKGEKRIDAGIHFSGD